MRTMKIPIIIRVRIIIVVMMITICRLGGLKASLFKGLGICLSSGFRLQGHTADDRNPASP